MVDAREMAPAAASEDMYKNKWNESKFGKKKLLQKFFRVESGGSDR